MGYLGTHFENGEPVTQTRLSHYPGAISPSLRVDEITSIPLLGSADTMNEAPCKRFERSTLTDESEVEL